MNELGVVFTPSGTIEGGTFRFTAGHFEWLANFAAALGLTWTQIGKRCHGRASTLAFCDALMEWYSSARRIDGRGRIVRDRALGRRRLLERVDRGAAHIKSERLPELPLGFWTWHDAIEENHAAHTTKSCAKRLPSRAFRRAIPSRGRGDSRCGRRILERYSRRRVCKSPTPS